MFFILSSGRSGTMTISRVLSQINGCVCLHEPSPELILESSEYHYGKLSKEKIKDLLLKTRKPFVDGSVYCESNQTLSLMIPVLADAFPEARYVWLIRNGLDVVASIYQKQWYSGHSENHDSYEDCPPIEKAWIDGRIRGDLSGDMSSDEWATLDRFGRCCWYWAYVNRIIENDLNRHASTRYYRLRLEEIYEDLPTLIDWMGLKASIAPLVGQHNIAKRIPYHWTDWTESEWEKFEHWCGDLMDCLYPSWRMFRGKESKILVRHYLRVLKDKTEMAQKQREELFRLKSENRRMNSEINGIKNSWSWRLTLPLRAARKALQR